MKVKYSIFNHFAFEEINKVNPELANVKDFTTEGTGEVIEFIKGGMFSSHKFLICDDKTKQFIEVSVNECIKLE